MNKRKFYELLLPAIWILFVLPVMGQQKEPLKGTMQVYKIVLEDDKPQRYRVEEAKPGDTLEYLIKYTNTSDQVLKNIELIGPIPKETYLIASSIKVRFARNMRASADNGVSYQTPPLKRQVKKGENVIEEEIPENQWTNMKWTIARLDPKDYAGVRYWVKVR